MTPSVLRWSGFTLSLLAAPACGQVLTLTPMPPELEMRFALSALPAHLRADATVHLLDPANGYVLGRQGNNGFTCIVERTEWARPIFRDDVYTPVCFDAEGTKHQLRVYMDVAQLRAQGWSSERVRAEIEGRFQRGTYRAPARSGVSYMIAPLMRTYPSPVDTSVMTMALPHFMFYAPGLTDQDIGSAPPPSPYPFILEPGPHGYIVVLVGETERSRILAESADLLKDLCAFRSMLCLPPGGR